MNTPWRKSSHSTGTGGECVEVAGLPGAVAIRDSKNPDGPTLAFGRHEFRALLDQVKSGPLRPLNGPTAPAV